MSIDKEIEVFETVHTWTEAQLLAYIREHNIPHTCSEKDVDCLKEAIKNHVKKIINKETEKAAKDLTPSHPGMS